MVVELGSGQAIPEGSLVFTGSYKGNPAYNVVLLYDQDGNIVGGVNADGDIVAHQIILAPDPAEGQLGEGSEGYSPPIYSHHRFVQVEAEGGGQHTRQG